MKLAMYNNQPTFVALQNGQFWGVPITGYDSIDDILNDWQNFLSNVLIDINDDKIIDNDAAEQLDPEKFEQPVQHPRQLPAIGFNYLDHMKEMDIVKPKRPNVFNKFVSSLAGPHNSIHLSGDTVDWESELVIVIGRGGRNISREDAEDAIAGYTVGQDISDRTVQSIDGPSTQFDLGKSFKNYSPIGPYISTIADVDDIVSKNVTTKVNGEIMQQATVNKMIFDIQTLISYISGVIELYPGDLIFTGTPSGTGVGRDPQVFLKSGDVFTSEIDGLGTIQTKVN
ncbi:fumarylacetoacetate hydrolase family protein [Lentilactobacillus otakiensis]|nr:fumarylacetoacetate hydrolase family protein [Lentilactobacillus otakiensis]MBZ3776783.1 fumarylacetoacetate hydrolase family protein [Lentilactobacillus otakiensis]MDV3519314.1 fumarylacetoacetate hydrolase family protein [Lentilactobacillus otakiensis]